MSDLADQAGQYLRLRRALGHKLDDAATCRVWWPTSTISAPRRSPLLRPWRGRDAPTPTRLGRCGCVERRWPAASAAIWPGSVRAPRSRRWVWSGSSSAVASPFIYPQADIAALIAHARGAIPTPLRAATVETCEQHIDSHYVEPCTSERAGRSNEVNS